MCHPLRSGGTFVSIKHQGTLQYTDTRGLKLATNYTKGHEAVLAMPKPYTTRLHSCP